MHDKHNEDLFAREAMLQHFSFLTAKKGMNIPENAIGLIKLGPNINEDLLAETFADKECVVCLDCNFEVLCYAEDLYLEDISLPTEGYSIGESIFANCKHPNRIAYAVRGKELYEFGPQRGYKNDEESDVIDITIYGPPKCNIRKWIKKQIKQERKAIEQAVEELWG